MGHELDTSKGFHAIALRGGAKTAWHGYGNEIFDGDSIKVIAKKAGLDFKVLAATALFKDAKGKLHEAPETVINYRDDTLAPVGVVGKIFKIVQPIECLEFFRDFAKKNKMRIETAGSLRQGKIVWALAKLGKEYDFVLAGVDRIAAYMRLQTAFDGSRATDGVPTTVRQVCKNTETMVSAEGEYSGYRVPHSQVFDAKALQRAMGLLGKKHKITAELWNALIKRKVSEAEQARYFCGIFNIDDPKELSAVDKDGQPIYSGRVRNMIAEMHDAFKSGPGSSLKSAAGTAYGLLQAVTYWVDHKSTSIDRGDGKEKARLASSWFGLGHATKTHAQRLAAELVGMEEAIGYDKAEKKTKVTA